MEKFFGLKEKGTTVRNEIIAGTTTFMAIAYILMVNPGMFSQLDGVSYGACYIATAISAIAGTLVMALVAKLPMALAPGMGLNAFFVYTACLGLGYSFANALLFVLADGLIFVILTVTGLRKCLFEAIPNCVKMAIPPGIGLFIAFLGFQSSGIVINDPSTCVNLTSFNILGSATWENIMPVIITIAAVIIIAVLSKKNVKGAIIIGILGASVLYYLLGFTISGFYDGFIENMSFNPFSAFGEFFDYSFGKVFTDGFDFSGYLSIEGNSTASLIISFITTALAFCMVDMFDTMGCLYGACKTGGLLVKNEKGEEDIPNAKKAMLSDAIATCVGAVCGTSTVTTYVESSAGVAVGGRTGLTSVVTSAFFVIALFLSPVAMLIPSCAYSAALIYLGVLMISNIADINWKDPAIALPSFLTLVMMPFTYNVSYGISFGIISYVAIKIFSGKYKEINKYTYLVAALFVIMFLFTH